MDKGPRIAIFSVGKSKEHWLELALEEYVKRLKQWCRISFVFVKDNEQLIKALQKQDNYICLDPTGKLMSSLQFASHLDELLVQWKGEITYVIGGAEGIPESVKQGKKMVSLSPLTFTHQMTRLILIEQIYRAFTLSQGLPYHK